MIRLLPLAALLLAAAPPPPGETITLRHDTSPLCGRCWSYAVTVRSDGQGTIEQRRLGAPADHAAFRWTPAELAAFARRLRPLRPNGEVRLDGGQPLCKAAATDQDSVDIRWTGGPGDPRHLFWYLGCDMDAHRDLFRALAVVEQFPPLAPLLRRP